MDTKRALALGIGVFLAGTAFYWTIGPGLGGGVFSWQGFGWLSIPAATSGAIVFFIVLGREEAPEPPSTNGVGAASVCKDEYDAGG